MEASLRSCTFWGSNIGAVPIPVRDAGLSSRLLRVSSSRARRLELCNGRATSSEQGGDGEEVAPGKKGITFERVAVRDRFRTISATIELNFGSSSSDDGFCGSPLPVFEDEFFARMMALEASPPSSSRASSTSAGSFFEGSTLCAGCEPPRPSSGHGVEASTGKGDAQRDLGALGKGGVQLPSPPAMPPLPHSSLSQALAMATRTPSLPRRAHRASTEQTCGATVSTLMGDTDPPRTSPPTTDMAKPSHREMMQAWVESTMRTQATQLESDKYACFDRTDLEYQLALAKDPGSAALLSNFAQFLFVVRRDNDRAEQYFHRAMEADPQDSTILGRFASFLWLGRGNRLAAERA